jgi:hypothetical protein
MTPWWVPLVAALLGVTVGFFLTQAKEILSRRQRRRTHWAALRAELEFCRRRAETYVRDRVAAPLYRLPTSAYSHSFPALLSDGAVTEVEADALMQFFSEVETLNRGLDLAQAAREGGDNAAVSVEFQRNTVKASRLFPPDGGGSNYYTAVRSAVDAHLQR